MPPKDKKGGVSKACLYLALLALAAVLIPIVCYASVNFGR